MRRVLSIFLILFFSLAPVASALGSSEDARLPACCRRHGTHHCAMAMQMAARMAEAMKGKHAVTAPNTCPCFPGYTAQTIAPVHALAAPLVAMPALLARPHSPATARAAARLAQMRRRSSRAPPAFISA
jgi:hypothetical protein